MRKGTYYVIVVGVLAGLLMGCGRESGPDSQEVTSTEIEITEMTSEEKTTQEATTEADSAWQETDNTEMETTSEKADTGTKEADSVSMTSEEAEKLYFRPWEKRIKKPVIHILLGMWMLSRLMEQSIICLYGVGWWKIIHPDLQIYLLL